MEEALAAKTTTEWLELIEAEDMFAAPVNSMGEAFSDPAVAHTEMVVELDTPVGPMKFFGVPYKLDTTPASVRSPPPLHGQHTNEVLGGGLQRCRDRRIASSTGDLMVRIRV